MPPTPAPNDTPSTGNKITLPPIPNQPPSIEPQGSSVLTVERDEEIVIRVVASDPEGQTISFAVEDLPQGASVVDFGEGTLQITWRPTAINDGLTTLRVVATDPQGGSVAQLVTVLVEADSYWYMPIAAE